ncbi:MAG: hypothetical protein OK457_00125 [Thaumarchaeota archaeon]|nr:hypothetical protein [Nitrososphaerota archaeon]
MLIEPRKDFEKPDTGEFNGTIVDIVDLGKVKSQYGEKVQLRVVWVLGTPDGSGKYAMDTEGNPFRVMRQVNASIDEKSKLYEIAKGVLGTAPPIPFDPEILLGRSNKLFIEKGSDSKTGKVYANVKFITFLPAGHVPPPIPQGFVRSKDRPAKTFITSAAPAVAPAPVVAVSPNTVGATPVPQGIQANPAPVVAAAPQPVVSTAKTADVEF